MTDQSGERPTPPPSELRQAFDRGRQNASKQQDPIPNRITAFLQDKLDIRLRRDDFILGGTLVGGSLALGACALMERFRREMQLQQAFEHRPAVPTVDPDRFGVSEYRFRQRQPIETVSNTSLGDIKAKHSQVFRDLDNIIRDENMPRWIQVEKPETEKQRDRNTAITQALTSLEDTFDDTFLQQVYPHLTSDTSFIDVQETIYVKSKAHHAEEVREIHCSLRNEGKSYGTITLIKDKDGNITNIGHGFQVDASGTLVPYFDEKVPDIPPYELVAIARTKMLKSPAPSEDLWSEYAPQTRSSPYGGSVAKLDETIQKEGKDVKRTTTWDMNTKGQLHVEQSFK